MSEPSKYINYKHESADEMSAFLIKMAAKARSHENSNVGKLFKHANKGAAHGIEAAGDVATANQDLHDLLVNNIINNDLIRTLGTSYEDNGIDALKYIKDCFSSSSNDAKLQRQKK